MAEQDTTTQNIEGKFTQAQLETKIGERLSRERKSIASKLGIESMDKLDAFLDSNKSNVTLKNDFQEKNTTLTNTVKDKEITIDMLKANIDPDQLDNAKALTQVKLSKDDTLNFKTGLEKLVEEMPFLIRGTEQQKNEQQGEKPKVGVEVKNQADTRTEKDKHDEKYKNSIYYRK
jgi:hypothetical protein